jgi:hypothetical protein
MALPMNNPGWLYPLLWVGTAVVIIGLVSSLQSLVSNRQSTIINLQSLILLTTFLLTLTVHIGYNVTFVQHQGRYLFPALLPIGVGVAMGLRAWLRLPFLKRYTFLPNLIPLGLGLGLVLLDLWALFRIIVPGLA